jgi:hypothetical protein
LTLFAVAPFFQPGYFWGAHDARHHVYFLHQFDRVVQDGMLWPRWSPDFAFGYGYPFFNIYGPFSHFVAQGLRLALGLDFVVAVKTVFALGIVASAGAMYGYVRYLAGPYAGVLAAVAYTYVPYHLLLLYVRANLAESTAFVWLPLCLWAFHSLIDRPTVLKVLAAALAYAGLMLTSNLLFVLFSPLLILYILALLGMRLWSLASWRSRLGEGLRLGVPAAVGGIGGLGLSAIFWLPMALERNAVRVDQWFDGRYNFRDDFLYFYQFFSPRWGFGSSIPGPDDPIGFQLGGVILLFALLGGLVAWHQRPLRPVIVLFAGASVVGAALGWQPFAPLWDWPIIGGILQSAQFPWRWLPISALGLSVLVGLLLAEQKEEIGRLGDSEIDQSPNPLLTLLLPVAVLILASYPLIQIEVVEPAEGPVSLAGLMRFQRDADEMTGSTAWVRQIPTWSPMAEYYVQQDEAGLPVEPVTSKLDYEAVDYVTIGAGSVFHNTITEEVYFCTNPGSRPGQCSPRDDSSLTFNHFYYPGWRAFLLTEAGGEPVEELPIVPEGCWPTPAEIPDPGNPATGILCPPFPSYADAAARIAAETRSSVLGRMVVPVPPVGEGYIRLVYGTTPVRTLGERISLVFLSLFALGLVWAALRRYGKLGNLRFDLSRSK